MPIYEYVCQECGTKFETIRPMKAADDPIPCDKCESLDTKRALSVCFSHGSSKSQTASKTGGCGSCGGGSCGSCNH